ncbi:bifunctional molybdenum cofactor biosynthesis protein MoaC/MoaB [Rhodocytophaga rosea]|uniref:Bifunctional molybdenum cofactor biosynthesis protein MoaC/MoaB n=1 Tax=Rhodocytophaga rosea TaxID=2704465 RepID=A0A6C0GVK0_9BACT|nr:bifunctional molybdenum cofactor biosynthesis protein MoaC/MoaB [Rhodocytophaga rosea]QHT71583.1 bifunctional molybdenum cofactor biosynthesis protein MoaC/MoaB [Rhodocytophaga rosea]
MRDISSKQISLRTARAVAVVLCSQYTLELMKNDDLPKGNLFDVARAAGFLAAKQTQMLIPHCHPVSIDGMNISYAYLDEANLPEEIQTLAGKTGVAIIGEGKSIGRTGIEMETLTTVSISALTIYDLLKPLADPELEITSIKLLKKTGGKSDRIKFTKVRQAAAVLVCSDGTASGKRDDKSGLLIQEMLKPHNIEIADYKILPDDTLAIREQVQSWVAQKIPFIFTTGGTGFGPRDNTIAAIQPILEKEASGITEAMRVHGQMRTPLAMMSRSVAGSIGQTLIVTLPGSSTGVRESLDAILPAVFHARNMLRGGGHE